MPTYTYECKSCSDTVELRQSFSEDPLTIHDNCGGSLRRIIYPAGIVFKGSGFYNTDYKNATPAAKPAGDTPPADGAETKTSETAASDANASPSASANDSASGSKNDSNNTPAPAKSESSASSTPAPATP